VGKWCQHYIYVADILQGCNWSGQCLNKSDAAPFANCSCPTDKGPIFQGDKQMAGIKRQNIIVTSDDCKGTVVSTTARKDLVLFLVGDHADREAATALQDKLFEMLPDLKIWINNADVKLPNWKYMRVDASGLLHAFEKEPIRWYWLGEHYGEWFVDSDNTSVFVSNTHHGLHSIFKDFFIERLLTKTGVVYRVNYSPISKSFV